MSLDTQHDCAFIATQAHLSRIITNASPGGDQVAPKQANKNTGALIMERPGRTAQGIRPRHNAGAGRVGDKTGATIVRPIQIHFLSVENFE